MNRSGQLSATIIAATLGSISSWAGTITYVGIPSTQSDSNCGISRNHGYTTAVDAGNTRGADRALNGITLFSLTGRGQNTATADNCTLNALSGTLTDAGLTSKNMAADGTVRDVLSDMMFNNAGGDNSQIEIVLDPEGLEQGATYDLRVYICSSSGQNRQVNLAFFGDGQNGVETGFFNEDDARTSAGGFPAASQVYYINYRYTWDGDSTPGITVTQKFGGAPFCLYALTNELIEDQNATAGGGAAEVEAGALAQGGAGEGEEGLSAGVVDQESDQIGVQSDDFYGSESLNSYGRWIKLSKWGTCWQPTEVATGWCPYTNGTWKQCDDCGWTFVSDEPWAWACYHYGRWAKVSAGCGWAWVPGTVWAPSWVSWRQGKTDSSSIGWAPLPPEAGCQVDVGVSSWVDSTCNIGPECYTFINIRDFGLDSYFGCGCIYERLRNPTIIIDTFNCTNIYYGRRVNIYCGGPDYNWCNTRIRQLGGKECGKVYVNRYDNPNRLGGKWAQHNGDQLGLVSPRIRGTKNPHNRPKIAETVGSNKIDHGWKGIKDKNQEQQVRNHIAQESKGKNPRNSPAKLPDDVAEKMKSHQGRNAQNVGQLGQGSQAAGGNAPGGKINRQGQGQGQSAQGGAGQAQAGADQHPVKGGRNKGQGQVAGAGAGAAGSANAAQGTGGGFDQHPGKNRGRQQGRNAQSQQQQQQQEGAGNNQTGGGNVQATGGGGSGRHHPGQSVNRETGGAAGGAGSAVNQGTSTAGENAGGGGQRGGRRRGKGQTGQTGNQSGASGSQTGQTNAGGEAQGQGGEGSSKNRHRSQRSSGAGVRGSGGGQQMQSQAEGGGQTGGGGEGRKSQGTHHQPQQQQQPHQRQVQQQQQQQQQPQGKRRRGQSTPTPPPR